jgi:NAD(P)-dependent dehydrogenase (short-subunit alcohol dehydrogenase family)
VLTIDRKGRARGLPFAGADRREPNLKRFTVWAVACIVAVSLGAEHVSPADAGSRHEMPMPMPPGMAIAPGSPGPVEDACAGGQSNNVDGQTLCYVSMGVGMRGAMTQISSRPLSGAAATAIGTSAAAVSGPKWLDDGISGRRLEVLYLTMSATLLALLATRKYPTRRVLKRCDQATPEPGPVCKSAAMDISLSGKVALVTGGSKGIGKAIAMSMAASGASVVIVSRKKDQLEAAAAEIRTANSGSEVLAYAANSGSSEAGQACVAATIERFGGLDVIVNNAATNPYYGESLGVDEARFDKTFQVNLRGPLFWCQAAWQQAMSHTPGVMINIASVGGLRAEAGLGIYNLTKAALIHLTRQLASELGPTRVVGIAPGLVQTDFAAFLVDNFGDRLAAQLPLGRLGVPQDIANLAVFLASDAASWITGETYVIDGGAGVRGVS